MTTVANASSGPRPASRHPGVLAVAITFGAYLVGVALGTAGALSTAAGAIGPDQTHRPAWQIFVHNLGVLIWLAGGTLTGGVLVVGIMGLNGMLLGWVAAKQVVAGEGHLVVVGILPHMPLELAAYVICGAASMLVGVRLVRRLLGRTRIAPPPGWRRWLVIQAIGVALLAAAAVVEANLAHV
jgi:uncharacterized membrane protein SpoIIM required for sporulation